jgi:hypothetical protein
LRVDDDLSVHQLETLPHADQAEAGSPLRIAGIETAAVVADFESHLVAGSFERDPAVLRAGMLDDVGQGLL